MMSMNRKRMKLIKEYGEMMRKRKRPKRKRRNK